MTMSSGSMEAAFNAEFSALIADITVAATKWADAYTNYASTAETFLNDPIDTIPSAQTAQLYTDILAVLDISGTPTEAQLAQGYVDAIKQFWIGNGTTTFPLDFGFGAESISLTSFVNESIYVTALTNLFSDTDWVGNPPAARKQTFYDTLDDLTKDAVTASGHIK